jgi:hypothetical protein
VVQNRHATNLLTAGVAEGVVRTDYQDVRCQIRMDWLNPQEGIVDLKTCDDLSYFEADARRFRYMHQLAFYRAVLAHVVGTDLPVHLVAIEKKEPFRCGVWQIAGDALDVAAYENRQAIERLKRCEAANVWPTGYEDLRTFDAA